MIAQSENLAQGPEEETQMTRVVLANEPRSYREVFASVFQALRPHLEVIIIEPEDLYDTVRSMHPQIVVCGRITSELKHRIPYWIEVYVEDEKITVESNVRVTPADTDVGLAGLISLIDEAERLLGTDENIQGDPM